MNGNTRNEKRFSPEKKLGVALVTLSTILLLGAALVIVRLSPEAKRASFIAENKCMSERLPRAQQQFYSAQDIYHSNLENWSPSVGFGEEPMSLWPGHGLNPPDRKDYDPSHDCKNVGRQAMKNAFFETVNKGIINSFPSIAK
jgi:hypothetical protein